MLRSMLFLAVLACSATETVIVPKISSAPSAGDWDGPNWYRAALFDGFVNTRNVKQPRLESVSVRILHDGTYLSLLAQVEMPSGISPSATTVQRDGAADKDDSVEIFLIPNCDKNSIYQIVVNSKGTILDLHRENNVEKREWNCPGLEAKVATRKGIGNVWLWEVQLRIPLASLGLREGAKFQFNAGLNDSFSVPRQHWSWAPVERHFLIPEAFSILTLGKAQDKGGHLSFSEYAEQLPDGHFEYGCDDWTRSGKAYRSDYYCYSGKYCLMFKSDNPQSVNTLRKTIPVKPGETFRVFGAIHLQGLDQPDFSPAYVEFLSQDDRVLQRCNAPGLKNGGAATSVKHSLVEFSVKAPPESTRARLVWHLNGTTGAYRLDAASFRREYPQWSLPMLLSPGIDKPLYSTIVTFRWTELPDAGRQKISYILEISKDPKFASGVIRTEKVYPEHSIVLNENGKWFWRIGVNHQEGDVKWTAPNSFLVDCTSANERIAPEIVSMEPFGLLREKPAYLTVKYRDPYIASGMDVKSVKLIVNGRNVTEECRVTENELSWPIPKDQTSLYHYTVQLKDLNRNSLLKYGYFYVRESPHMVTKDDANFICRDGKRIFPVSLYGVSLTNTYPRMAKEKLNTNFSPWGSVESNYLPHLEEAVKNGMFMVPFAPNHPRILRGEVAPDSATGKVLQEKKYNNILSLKDHPAVLGFYIGDEDLDKGTQSQQARIWYQLIKETAPNQLVYWLPTYQLDEPRMVLQGLGGCDYFVWHCYYVNCREPLRIVKRLDFIRKATNDIPNYAIIEAFKYGENGIFPTYQDIRFQTYFSIISKARGIIFYTDHLRRDFADKDPYANVKPGYLENVFRVSRELYQLKDALVADDRMDLHTIQTDEGEARSLGKKVGNTLYVIVVNTGKDEFRGKIVSGWKNVTDDSGKPADPTSIKIPTNSVMILKGTI